MVATAAATAGLVERYRLDAVDVEYASRRTLLAARQTEQPDRPLFVVAGSSRMVLGFTPELLPPTADAGDTPPTGLQPVALRGRADHDPGHPGPSIRRRHPAEVGSFSN